MKHLLLLAILIFFFSTTAAMAFQEGGCGEGSCRDCHGLTVSEAQSLLKDVGGVVREVKLSEVPGLWAVNVEKDSKTIPVYIDFSKQYLIGGKIIKLSTREDVTGLSYINLNRVNVSKIPLTDALVIGNPKAKQKIIVFDDPECPACKNFHPEMEKVVAAHKDIVFLIKMYPLQMHPNAYGKAKAIICAKSAAMLAESLQGKKIPAPSCETDQVDKNIALAKELGINSTPTMVFPDGRVFPGGRDAATIVRLLNEKPEQLEKPAKPAK